jgi:hypothetical protein
MGVEDNVPCAYSNRTLAWRMSGAIKRAFAGNEAVAIVAEARQIHSEGCHCSALATTAADYRPKLIASLGWRLCAASEVLKVGHLNGREGLTHRR